MNFFFAKKLCKTKKGITPLLFANNQLFFQTPILNFILYYFAHRGDGKLSKTFHLTGGRTEQKSLFPVFFKKSQLLSSIILKFGNNCIAFAQ